ncbi:MAG TPA: methyltransferase domain-containing protein [Thermoanaerobaculia bacterium]|nr:methyltransferase domain-containing protein [Thermoanaerobaculia bacterium]
MSTDDKVRHHFDLDAERFDAIYEDRKGPFARFVDNVWRGVVRKRLDLTLETLAPFAGKTVLDVGCGSGRYCFAYVQHGAQHVVGVDFAPAMIDIAHELAKRLGVEERCEFRVGRFPEAVSDGPFDYSTAMGFFDYIEDPVAIVRAMRDKTTERMALSFPKAIEWRVPIRRLRFLLSRCPLYLYTRRRVEEILAAAGIDDYDWINLDRDYVVIARLKR